ncbi:MAG: GtrA family protein [Deltaproteobacteria bacterium]|nr:MAG: GtrA family protein [Deltaproteobacteria bacterium]
MKLYQQIQRFIMSGLAASGVHYVIYLALVKWSGVPPGAATIVGFILGSLVSYHFNRKYTFEASSSMVSFFRFFAVTLAGGGLNLVLVLLLDLFLHFAIAGFIAIALAAAFNFLGHRFWTFAAGKRGTNS